MSLATEPGDTMITRIFIRFRVAVLEAAVTQETIRRSSTNYHHQNTDVSNGIITCTCTAHELGFLPHLMNLIYHSVFLWKKPSEGISQQFHFLLNKAKRAGAFG